MPPLIAELEASSSSLLARLSRVTESFFRKLAIFHRVRKGTVEAQLEVIFGQFRVNLRNPGSNDLTGSAIWALVSNT